VSYHNRLTANTHTTIIIMPRKRPTLKETQRQQAATQIPPEVWQAIQYLEYRKLRHKHPHA